MERLLPIEFDSKEAYDAVLEVCCVIRDAEMCAHAKSGGGGTATNKPGSRVPPGSPEGVALVNELVGMLRDTLDGKRDKNGKLTFTGMRKKLATLISRESRSRNVVTCIEVQACVTSPTQPCRRPAKCHLALESAIAQGMPQDAVALTRTYTPEQRTEAARKAAQARWGYEARD